MVLLLAGWGMAGCGAMTGPPPEAVARLGGEWLADDPFQSDLERIAGPQSGDLSSEVLSRLLDRWLDERLLKRLAVDRGVVRPEHSPRRAVDRLLAAEPLAEPTDEEVAEHYRRHLDDYRRPERVRLRQMLLDRREIAERARQELEAGEDFVAVARRHSPEALGGLAASPEELSREDLPPAFEDTIFELAVGEVSPVVEAEYGYHLFQVERRLPAEALPLEAVAGQIRLRLVQRATDRRLRALVREARKKYPVVVVARNLPFDYRGTFPTLSPQPDEPTDADPTSQAPTSQDPTSQDPTDEDPTPDDSTADPEGPE